MDSAFARGLSIVVFTVQLGTFQKSSWTSGARSDSEYLENDRYGERYCCRHIRYWLSIDMSTFNLTSQIIMQVKDEVAHIPTSNISETREPCISSFVRFDQRSHAVERCMPRCSWPPFVRACVRPSRTVRIWTANERLDLEGQHFATMHVDKVPSPANFIQIVNILDLNFQCQRFESNIFASIWNCAGVVLKTLTR